MCILADVLYSIKVLYSISCVKQNNIVRSIDMTMSLNDKSVLQRLVPNHNCLQLEPIKSITKRLTESEHNILIENEICSFI